MRKIFTFLSVFRFTNHNPILMILISCLLLVYQSFELSFLLLLHFRQLFLRNNLSVMLFFQHLITFLMIDFLLKNLIQNLNLHKDDFCLDLSLKNQTTNLFCLILVRCLPNNPYQNEYWNLFQNLLIIFSFFIHQQNYPFL